MNTTLLPTEEKREISRKARGYFRRGQYTEVLDLLENIEKDTYLESLYTRAKRALTPQVKEEPQEKKQSFTEFFNQKKEEREVRKKETQNIKNTLKTDLEEKEEEEKQKISSKQNSMGGLKKQQFQIKSAIDKKKQSILLVESLQKKETLEKLQKEGKIEEAKKVEQEVLDNEMRLAQNVQENLLPTIDKDIMPGIETYIKTISCSELSGDVFDVTESNPDEIIFYLGDVTGHGTAAGLVMTMISCLAHSVIKRTGDIKDILVTLNKEIKPKLTQNMFASMIMCKWNVPLKKLSYSGAGHEYILKYEAKTKKFKKIKTGGIAIGMIKDMSAQVQEKILELENDDVVLLYTDGLDEAWHETKQEMYGVTRILKDFQTIIKKENITAVDIGEYILGNILAFQGKKEKTDDMTLMVFKRKESAEEKEIKAKYIKEQIQKDLIKSEALMKNSAEELSPEMAKEQEKYAFNCYEIAQILFLEKNFLEARDNIKSALRIDPTNKSFLEFAEKLDETIYQENMKKGVLYTLFSGIKSFFKDLQKRGKNVKKQYLKNLYNDALEAISYGNIEKAEKLLQEMEAFNPKASFIPKLKKAIDSYKRENKSVLEESFSLEIEHAKQKQREKDHSLISEEELKKQHEKEKLAFKKKLSEEIEEKKEEEKPIDKEYDPKKAIKSDFFGIEELTELKDIYKKLSEEEKKKPKKEEEIQGITWDKGHMLTKAKVSINKFMAKLSPMNQKDLFAFIEKMAAFVKAGIPIQRSLEIIQEQAKNDGFKLVLEGLIKSIENGKMLSDAMKSFLKAFPEMLIYLVEAGEKSGALSLILNDIKEQMQENLLVKSKMKGAMVYPAIVLGSAFVMMLAILTFIVPQLQNVYGEAGAELPKITLVIVAISEFITGKWKFLLVSILSVILGLFVFLKTPTGKKVFDKIVLSLPVFGTIAKQNNMMLFTSNLSILMINGIHIGEALLVVSRVLPNYYYQQIVVQIRERMIDLGGSLSIAMDTPEIRKFFSQEVLQTVNAGEQTGKLAEMMEGSGNMIKEQIKNSVKALSETIEPFMIIGVGIVIAIILISVMFPLFNLRNVLGR